MIVLTASPDIRNTFEKLIENMEVPVKWNGLFVIIDNCLILQGEVRSLFFHFDSHKVATNIIDLEIPAQSVRMMGDNNYVKNTINMLLYTFGKWGTLKGLTVEKDYHQLSVLFENILRELEIEPDYSEEHFWFYKKGIRIVYEDVIQHAYEHKKEEEIEKEEERAGLWHKLVWKHTYENMEVRETNAKERSENRLGNNFYLTSYVCPNCNEKLHGVVYPVGKEFIIDTNEGQVRLARAFTCHNCCSFYTPRPRRLLIEGDCFVMDFLGDALAYDDYLELLGQDGDKVSNYNFNEYVDEKGLEAPNSKMKDEKKFEDSKMIEWMDEMPTLSESEFMHLTAKMIEGFYPENLITKIEKNIWKEHKKRRDNKAAQKTKIDTIDDMNAINDMDAIDAINEIDDKDGIKAKVDKYKQRIQLYKRLSERQRMELIKQIKTDDVIREKEKEKLLELVNLQDKQEKFVKFQEKIEYAKNKNKRVMYHVYEEIQKSDLKDEEKVKLWKETGITPLEYENYSKDQENTHEVTKNSYVEKLERRAKSALQDEIKNNEKIETTDPISEAGSFERKQKSKKKDNPKEDIRIIKEKLASVKQNDRNTLQQILDLLEMGSFDEIEAAPYLEDVKEKIKRIDEAYLDQMLSNFMQMSFEEAKETMDKISAATLLPELKTDALMQLEKRLAKIKTDECELLVQKLRKELEKAQIPENERHYFYPARRILMKEATNEETKVIDYAIATYGAGMESFEYPIWLADTSYNHTGDKGMFLTPENIYYSNFTTSYHISIEDIASVGAMNGIFNKGLYVSLKNGNKIKIPYAVDASQLQRFAKVIDSFIKYLQEKPFSRKEAYLVKDSHKEICCFRCGYVYEGKIACPKCGFKANR